MADEEPLPQKPGALAWIWRIAAAAFVLVFGWPLAILGGLLLVTFLHMMSPAGLRTGERDTLTPLGSIRAAMSLYYGDMEGHYPQDLAALTIGGKYMRELPLCWRPIHGDSPLPGRHVKVPHDESREVSVFSTFVSSDTGRWGYVRNPGGMDDGTVFIDCTHTDSKGTAWSSY